MSHRRLLIGGSTLSAVNIFLQVSISFFLTPFIISSLGKRLYGVWLLIAAFVGYYGLLDLGVSSAITRYVSRSIGACNREANKYYVSSSFFVLCIAGLLISLISISACSFARYFIKEPNDLYLFKFAVVILGLSVGISFPLRIFDGVLNANLRFDLKRYVEISEVILRSCLIILFLKLGYGIYGLAVAGAMAMLFDFGTKMLLALKIDRSISVKLSYFSFSKLRELFDFAIFNFIAGFSQILNNRIDLYVVTIFANLTIVSYYGIALSLATYFYQFFAAIQAVIGPFFSQKEGERNFEAIRRSLKKLIRLSAFIASILGIFVVLYGKQFIICWLGESFEKTYSYMIVLFIPLIISYSLFPTLYILNTTGHHRLSTSIELAKGLSNLILSLILGHKFGAIGVAWGTAVPTIIFDVIVRPIYSSRVVKLNPFYLWKEVFFIIGVSTTLFCVVWYFFGKSWVSNFFTLFVIGLINSFMLIIVAYFLFLKRDERAMVNNIFSNYIRTIMGEQFMP